MRRPCPSRTGERGAAVLLFVALVVAAAIAATASMMIGRPQFAVQQGTGTGFDMTALRKAVEAHALVANGGNVVCPDTDADGTNGDGNANGGCSGITANKIPWRTIGVTERQATDAWGQKVWIVRSDSANLELRSIQGTENECHFILVSGGSDLQRDSLPIAGSVVDIRDSAGSPSEDIDLAVCGSLGDPYDPSQHSLFTPSGVEGETAADNFTSTDDTNNHIAPDFKPPPHADWAASDEIMYFGGSSEDDDVFNLTASNITKASCSWHNTPFDFTDETLRGFIRFQFLPGEASASQTMNTSQGFSLMVIPGERTVSANSCGSAAADNAFGFKGVARPKFALEFDIFRDNYEGAADYSGGRNNPKPEGNHVALLNPLTNDYISHGGSGNPKCQVWGPDSDGPADGDWPGACTYPAADSIDRPERHATRPAHWLEDGQYMDDALGQNAAQPYVVRFEFKRLCNSDCSTCGVEGGTMVHAKAWIACDAEANDVTGTSDACPEFTKDFENVTESYAGTTDYMVNHCMDDRSLVYSPSNPAESFDTVKIGIGFSTRNSAVGFLLHRLEVESD